MDHKSSSERMAEALQRARRHWQAQHRAGGETPAPPAQPPPPFTIALSRDAGANGSLVAREVGARLGWVVYDRELLQRIAGEMGVRACLLESLDEKQVSWLRECLEAFTPSAAPVSGSAYVRHLVEALLSLSAHGECVIVGRGAAQVLPPERTLRVRLIGPVAERVRSVQERLGLSHEEASRWVSRTDQERTRFVQEHFHKDPAGPAGYDLVLNSARFSVPGCADLVVEALRRLRAGARADAPAS